MDDFKDDEVVDKALEMLLAKYPDEIEPPARLSPNLNDRGGRERFIYEHPRGIIAAIGELLSADGVTMLGYHPGGYRLGYTARRDGVDYHLSEDDLRNVVNMFIANNIVYRFNWAALQRV